MIFFVVFLVEFIKNFFCEVFVQFNILLVEVVDVLNSIFSECQVFVVDNQSIQFGGIDSIINKDGSGRVVIEEVFVRNQFIGSIFSFYLFVSFVDYEGFSLGEVVGCKYFLV